MHNLLRICIIVLLFGVSYEFWLEQRRSRDLALAQTCADSGLKFWQRNAGFWQSHFEESSYTTHYNQTRHACFVEAHGTRQLLWYIIRRNEVDDAIDGRMITSLFSTEGPEPASQETKYRIVLENGKSRQGGVEVEKLYLSNARQLMTQ